MAKKRVEAKLYRVAYQERLKTAKKLLSGKISKEEFAQSQAKEMIEGFKDKLTGLFNRGFFDEVIVLMTTLTQRQKKPLTLIILDLDDFKKINDQFGHPQGDRVLRAVGEAVKKSLRVSDIACRYGGEEIAILLPATPVKAAEKVVQRLRENLSQIKLKAGRKEIKINASFGLAAYQKNLEARKLIERADQALLQAKKTGKNKVVIYG